MNLIHDATLCWGCSACEQACRDTYNLPPQASLITISERVTAKETLSVSYAYTTCRQCADPACAHACPQKAISKDASGTVRIDEQSCVGCGRCAQTCPVSAIKLVFRLNARKAVKCQLCAQTGAQPACVQACPMGCLRYA